MVTCKLAQECFFPTDFSNNLPAQLATIKRTYCNQAFTKCARYIVAIKLGQSDVPYNLHPADIEQAEMMIKSASK